MKPRIGMTLRQLNHASATREKNTRRWRDDRINASLKRWLKQSSAKGGKP